MTIYCTDYFLEKYTTLTAKKYRKHYACFTSKLSKKLKDIPQKGITGDILVTYENVKCLKTRLTSCTNNGSSYGFRIIIVENRQTKAYYLLDAYPKYGTLSENASINVDSKQAANLLEQAAQQKLITVFCDEGDIEFVRQKTLEFEHNEEK